MPLTLPRAEESPPLGTKGCVGSMYDRYVGEQMGAGTSRGSYFISLSVQMLLKTCMRAVI